MAPCPWSPKYAFKSVYILIFLSLRIWVNKTVFLLWCILIFHKQCTRHYFQEVSPLTIEAEGRLAITWHSLRLTVFINLRVWETCSKSHLTLTVKGINVFTYGENIFSLMHLSEPLIWNPWGTPWKMWLGVILKLAPRGGDSKFPSPGSFNALISYVAPGHVFINFRSSLAQFLTSSWCKCPFWVFFDLV